MLGLDTTTQSAAVRPRVVVKKYANRRLYDTESSAYITLDDLAEMVRSGRDFVVYDARTGDDITRPVLTQVIMEEETRGRSILPTSFLRQLIGFYGDNLQGVVPEYLEQMMEQFSSRSVSPVSSGSVPYAALIPAPKHTVSGAEVAVIERAAQTFAPVLAARHLQDVERQPMPTREEMQAEILALKAEIVALKGGRGH